MQRKLDSKPADKVSSNQRRNHCHRVCMCAESTYRDEQRVPHRPEHCADSRVVVSQASLGLPLSRSAGFRSAFVYRKFRTLHRDGRHSACMDNPRPQYVYIQEGE
jgi:hypothetical protein